MRKKYLFFGFKRIPRVSPPTRRGDERRFCEAGAKDEKDGNHRPPCWGRTSFLIVILSYLLIHLVFLFVSPFVFYQEDNKIGSLALDLINGHLRLPFWLYMDSPHAGGSIFSSLISIPFYLIFGQNYLALKLTGLFLSLAIFVILLYFLYSQYGKEIILPFSLLFIFPPSNLLIHQFIRIGNNSELVLLITLSLITAFYFFKKKAKSKRLAGILGFLCGFGLWVQYGQITAIATVLLIWFLIDKKFFLKKNFFVFTLFFIIGFLPFIIFNLQYGFASFISDSLLRGNTAFKPEIILTSFNKIPQQFFNLLFSILPASFLIPGLFFFDSKNISYIFYSIIIFLVAALLVKEKNLFKKNLVPRNIFIIYFLVSLFFFTIFSFPNEKEAWGAQGGFHYYYRVFLHPFILVLATIGFVKIYSKKMLFFVLLGIMTLISINGFIKTTLKESREVLGAQVGKPSYQGLEKKTVLWGKIGFNGYLFEDNADIKSNAFEVGFNYAKKPKLFKKIFHHFSHLDKPLREKIFDGAGVSFSYFFQEKDSLKLDSELKRALSEMTSVMNNEEKKTFFVSVLVGEWFWFRGENHILPIYNLLQKEGVLEDKDKQIFTKVSSYF